MTPFELIRAQVLPALPAPCLVAPDRTGRAFLVSDFPARYGAKAARAAGEALTALGFCVDVTGNTAHIDWTAEALGKWLGSLPRRPLPAPNDHTFALWGICKALLMHETPDALPDVAVVRRAFHLMNQKDIPALTKHLGEALAVALRTSTAPPVGAVRLLTASNLLT